MANYVSSDPLRTAGAGVELNPPTLIADRAPLATDIRPLGTLWVDKTNDASYQATSAGNWELLGSATGAVATLSSDSGTATPAAGDIDIAGGTNITTAGSGATITANLDAAITLATSITSPIYTAAGAMALNMPAGAFDLTVKLADAAGAQKLSFTDSADAEIASLDSDGAFSLLAGDCVVSRSDSAAEVLSQVTNSDNTSADSDAFVEVAVGGTASGNPGIRFQISGGQNYAMGIDNADDDKLVICADNDIGTDVLVKMDETTKDVEIAQGNLVIGAVAKQLQMNGGAVTDFIGQATLVAGTVTVANTNIAAGDRVFVTRSDVNGSTALGVLDVSITASTNFIIDARNPADATVQTNDISVVDYFIVRQN